MNARNSMSSVTLALLFAAAPAALAASAVEPAAGLPREQALALETLKGKIRSVGEESFVLMVDGEAHTVQLTEDTKYLLDGKEARKGQVVKADQEVSVTIEDGSATEVSARSAG